MSDLSRNLDPGWMGPAERAALEEQGMAPELEIRAVGGPSGATPGMVVGDAGYPTLCATLSRLEMERLRGEVPNVGIIAERSSGSALLNFSGLAINPKPVVGEFYWLWAIFDGRDQWVPAVFYGDVWGVPGVGLPWSRTRVKLWRGPMLRPSVPMPAQLAALNRQVHDATDLEVSG